MDAQIARRERMVQQQVAARGVDDVHVLAAMRAVPRERFVPDGLRDLAYEDSPLPIDAGQTISQPYIVALMLQAAGVAPGRKVLEIGAGSGYAAAVMAAIGAEVFTIERVPELAALAEKRLHDAGFEEVHVRLGDGTMGWPEAAPFDAILAAAGGPKIPEALVRQLAPGGHLVMPVGEQRDHQRLVRVTRDVDGELLHEDLGGVRFVPLIGRAAWDEATSVD